MPRRQSMAIVRHRLPQGRLYQIGRRPRRSYPPQALAIAYRVRRLYQSEHEGRNTPEGKRPLWRPRRANCAKIRP